MNVSRSLASRPPAGRPLPACLAAALAVGLSALSAGCNNKPSCDPKPYNVLVSVDRSLRENGSDTGALTKRVFVDLVGVSEDEKPAWDRVSVNDYISAQDPSKLKQNAARVPLEFTPDKPDAQKLASNDPMWGKWMTKKAQYLYVIAYVQRVTSENNQDLRRQWVPLGRCRWDLKDDTIRISVSSGGVEVESKPKPEPAGK